MLRIARVLNRHSLVGLLAAALGTSTIGDAQTPPSCGGTPDYISVEPGKPFTSERVTHSPDGSEQTIELVEFVAREAAGRVRIEKRSFMRSARGAEKITLNTREGGTITTTRDMLGAHILTFDCPGGKIISIQPGMQIAMVTERSIVSPAHPQARLYSSFFDTLAGKKLPPSVTFEDLGTKKIEGIPAHGFKTTDLGTEDDGEWNGKPTRVFETWVSDELAATVLQIRADIRNKKDDRTTLTHIKREEPEASLFEVPTGYKINPTPQELPFELGHPTQTDEER